jgi:hypothetical protein
MNQMSHFDEKLVGTPFVFARQNDECTILKRQNDTLCRFGTKFSCETVDLESSTFYFQGREKVTQPSILQIYHRVVRNDVRWEGEE